MKGKSTDGLMRHLRDNNGIHIKGSKHKKDLLLMGYYHGYKGYRFIREDSNTISFTKFDEVNAIYSFDINIKTLLYPLIMTIETAIKNYTLDTLITFGNIDLDSVFKNQLIDYKNYPASSKPYKEKLQENQKLKSKIDNEISFKYSKSPILRHFLHKGQPLPL